MSFLNTPSVSKYCLHMHELKYHRLCRTKAWSNKFFVLKVSVNKCGGHILMDRCQSCTTAATNYQMLIKQDYKAAALKQASLIPSLATQGSQTDVETSNIIVWKYFTLSHNQL